MDTQKQEAMDGSPAVVQRTLADLIRAGKFSDARYQDPLAPVVDGDRVNDPVIQIRFQCGPIQEVGVNGCSIEDVIDVLIERLDGFQRGPFRCSENSAACVCLRSAKGVLLLRTARRQAQGVEGTSAPHRSKP